MRILVIEDEKLLAAGLRNDRLALWIRQLELDVSAGDSAFVLGDVAVLEAIWDRVDHAVDASASAGVDAAVADLRDAADAEDLGRVGELVAPLSEALSGTSPTQP